MFSIDGDPLSVGSYAITPARYKSFLECPFVNNEEFLMLCLARVDGVVGGRLMFYPVLFKAGDVLLEANGGSPLFMHDDFRKLDLAVEIVMYPNKHKK